MIGRMKIAVVGAGAMGSVYAGILGDAGNEVWALDVWTEHVEAINRDGLTIEGASGRRTVRINATSDAADIGLCDLVVIATKDRKSTRLNSSHGYISYAVFCLKKKKDGSRHVADRA